MGFYEEANRGEDLFTAVGSLERMLAQHTENIRHLLGTSEDQTSGLRKINNRTANLEKAINKLQHQAGRSMDCGGLLAVPAGAFDADSLGSAISICGGDRSRHSSLGVPHSRPHSACSYVETGLGARHRLRVIPLLVCRQSNVSR